jgi:hypothetical protein
VHQIFLHLSSVSLFYGRPSSKTADQIQMRHTPFLSKHCNYELVSKAEIPLNQTPVKNDEKKKTANFVYCTASSKLSP